MLVWLLGAALAGDALTYDAVRVVEHGVDVPRVIFHVGAAGTLKATATCSGRRWSLNQSGAAGTDLTLRLDGIAQGVHRCALDLSFVQADGADGGGSLELTVVSLPTPSLTTTFDEVDTRTGSVTVHADRPLSEARLTGFGAGGVVVADTRGLLSDPTAPQFLWDASAGEAVKLLVEAKDEHGLFAQLELLPWRYAIPHEDVVFETGSDEIREGEVGKLQAAWGHVVDTLAKYGSVVDIELFVAGYTDTVGDAASNQALSERRARSIARWFRDQGFDRPIHYQGFGESVLAVATPDETDEAGNRRALYLLAAEAPPKSAELPKSAWKKL